MLQRYAEDNVLTAVGKLWCAHMVEESRRHASDVSVFFFGKVVRREAQEMVEIYSLSCSLA